MGASNICLVCIDHLQDLSTCKDHGAVLVVTCPASIPLDPKRALWICFHHQMGVQHAGCNVRFRIYMDLPENTHLTTSKIIQIRHMRPNHHSRDSFFGYRDSQSCNVRNGAHRDSLGMMGPSPGREKQDGGSPNLILPPQTDSTAIYSTLVQCMLHVHLVDLSFNRY